MLFIIDFYHNSNIYLISDIIILDLKSINSIKCISISKFQN